MDGGKTWTITTLGGAQDGLDAFTERTDARVAFDAFGNCYVTYIVAASSTEIRLVAARSSDGGATFSFTAAASNPTLQADSPFIATGADAGNPSAQAVWIAYEDGATDRIYAVNAISTGLGQWSNFSAPIQVNNTPDGNYASVTISSTGQ